MTRKYPLSTALLKNSAGRQFYGKSGAFAGKGAHRHLTLMVFHIQILSALSKNLTLSKKYYVIWIFGTSGTMIRHKRFRMISLNQPAPRPLWNPMRPCGSPRRNEYQ